MKPPDFLDNRLQVFWLKTRSKKTGGLYEKKIAVIGSSGGNLRSQGGADPQKMMAEIFAQAKAAGIEVSAIQFILTEGSMDKISMDMAAALFSLDEVGQLISGKQQKYQKLMSKLK